MTEQVRTRAVLEAVLLRVLSQHSDGLPIRDVYDAVHSQYTFPSDWYREIPSAGGYTTLADRGYPDWRQIPQERLIELVSTEPQWQNEMRWARNDLRERGFLDTSARRGVWKLTPLGVVAAKTPDETIELRPEERVVAAPRPKSCSHGERHGHESIGPSPREALLGKLHTLISSMPLDDLDLLVDLARAVRLRSLGRDAAPMPAERKANGSE
jgi:restriction endonuclease Mrr